MAQPLFLTDQSAQSPTAYSATGNMLTDSTFNANEGIRVTPEVPMATPLTPATALPMASPLTPAASQTEIAQCVKGKYPIFILMVMCGIVSLIATAVVAFSKRDVLCQAQVEQNPAACSAKLVHYDSGFVLTASLAILGMCCFGFFGVLGLSYKEKGFFASQGTYGWMNQSGNFVDMRKVGIMMLVTVMFLVNNIGTIVLQSQNCKKDPSKYEKTKKARRIFHAIMTLLCGVALIGVIWRYKVWHVLKRK